MNDRLSLLFNEKELRMISSLKILIIGIGGVGGYVLESLVRTGVKNITIVDSDYIELSNINRQIIALNSNLNNSKVMEAKKRCLSINPQVNITALQLFINQDNIHDLDFKNFDYIIDACDTITTKILIIKKAQENSIKIISCMGTGNRLNPNDLMITKLSKTYNDPLSKVIRKLAKDANLNDVDVCFSKEIPIKVNSRTPGSAIFVPATAGLLISATIIQNTIKGA